MIEMLSGEPGMEEIIVDLLNSLSAVKDLSELNYNVGNEKELIGNALRVLIQNQDMERCSLFILDEQGYLVNLTGLSSHESTLKKRKNYKPLQFKLGEGVIGMAAQSRELQHCQNCKEDKRFAVGENNSNIDLPGSVISVPVIVNDELIGVLNISHPHPYYFNEWHLRMLVIYKNMLGQLISNYRLFQQMEREISKRTIKLEKALVDLNSLKEHFENMSMQDQLTGLYNRYYFYDQAEIAIAYSRRYGQALCLLMLDLDHFKYVNDRYGHGFGDEVLIRTSEAMKQQVRETDVLVRYGGEEFVVIFTNTDCENGMIFAERIRKSIEVLDWELDGFNQTVSIGLYCFAECCKDEQKSDLSIDKIVHYADVSLYEAKSRGRNTVVQFQPEFLEK